MGICKKRGPLFTKGAFRKQTCHALRNKHFANKAPRFTKQAFRKQSATCLRKNIFRNQKRSALRKNAFRKPKRPTLRNKHLANKAPHFTKQTSRNPNSLLPQRILRNSSKSQIALSVNRAVNLYNAVKSHKNATALCLCNSNFKAVTRNNRFNKLKSVHL